MMGILAVLRLFLALPALAYPGPGDFAVMEGDTLLRTGELTPLKVVTELVGYDQREWKWDVRITEERGGRHSVRNERHAALFTPELYREMMEKCRSRGGRVERITVSAGDFEVCHLLTAVTLDLTEETWYGNVPFGVVKKVETNFTDGRKDSLELASFRSEAQH